MAKKICVTNQKGGVGKTTTSNAFGLGLKEKGYRVLLVDLDPQGNLSFSVGAETENSNTIYEVLTGEASALETIQKTKIIDIIPANIILSGVDLEFTQTGREFLLKEALEGVEDEYDYIIIDTPPALNILTINAFAYSEDIIIPMLADIFSLQGITQLYETIDKVREHCNHSVKINGILLNRFNPREILSSEIKGTAELVAKQLHTVVYNTHIKKSIVIKEAQTKQENLFEYAPKNSAVKCYMEFVEEFISMGE